jgi:hypothetical protein
MKKPLNPDFDRFILRLHEIKFTRGDRKWTEHELDIISVIQATSVQLTNADYRKKHTLAYHYYMALDCLLDAFRMTVDEYVPEDNKGT